MKFTHAWAATVAQNVTLKVAVILLAITSSVLALTTIKLSMRKPLVIERSCYTKPIEQASIQHTQQELRVFVEEALKQRYNSDAVVIPGFLSQEEENIRTQEQKELSSRGMTQRVLVNSVKTDGDTFAVESDRLISVGQVRSAFLFPLKITISKTTRTEANPYGLILVRVTPVKSEESGK